MRFYRKDLDDYDSGPEFLMFASHLPYYQGAVRALFEAQEYSADMAAGSDEHAGQSPYGSPGQSMTMAEALAKGRGDELGVLDALNQENMNSPFGALFEREVVQITPH